MLKPSLATRMSGVIPGFKDQFEEERKWGATVP